MRERLGETVVNYPREYDNDAVGLDATRVTATEAFPAGWFASFHAYPYYPDFMMLDPRHLAAESPWGPSHYFGYLTRLKEAHPGMPVLIAEYGVPAGLQIAHLDPRGWHHGGHTESRMAEIDARLTREIDAAGMAGGVLFAWIDEWFKKNWAVIDFEIPPDRNRLWLNRLDAEQHYGMIAMEPAERLPGRRLEDRLPAWRERPPLYQDVDGALRAHADEAYLWLLFEPGRTPAQKLLIGFDMIDPEGGDHRWPGGAGPVVPVGLELALRVGDGEARLLADPPSNPYRIVQVRRGLAGEPRSRLLASTSRPPGYFEGRLEGWYNAPYVTRPNDDGVYEALRFIPNRPRFATDGTEYLAQGYDRGRLPRGPLPDALWETGAEGEVEVRIPWTLLNVTDPSGRRVLQDPPRALTAKRRAEAEARAKGLPRPEITSFETRAVESIRIVAARRSADGRWRSWPRSGATDEVAEFTWPTWEEPTWRSRRRPVFNAMREAFGRVGSPLLAAGGGR